MSRVDPISTTTEAVEHFHSLSHCKAVVQSVREYCSSFSVIVRECAKSMCSWSFQLYSGKESKSHYFRPDKNSIPLETIPTVPKLGGVQRVLSKEENKKARDLCIEYKALPQSSTRTFTSKFKAGTLPLQAYETDTSQEVSAPGEADELEDNTTFVDSEEGGMDKESDCVDH